LGLFAILAAFALSPTATGRPAADDLVLSVHLHNSTATTTGPNFQIEVEIETTTGVEQPIVVRTTLPPGLRWGADAPDPSEDCITANPAICTTRTKRNEVGTVGAGWFWDVVADGPGVYEITAAVEPSERDPDLSNNTDTFRVEVVSAPGGGSGGGSGGGGSGGGGVAAASVSAIKLSPARPKAGSTLVASVRVTRGGAPIRPVGVSCAAAIGGQKLKGAGKAASGVASCLFKTPKSSKDKTLAGAIALRAGGQRFTKRFSVRLG
jgi:hypothetical protein